MSTSRKVGVFAVGAACCVLFSNFSVLADDDTAWGLFENSFVGNGERSNSAIESEIEFNQRTDSRGDVSEWSFGKGNREIKRQVQSTESGGSTGLMGFGIRF